MGAAIALPFHPAIARYQWNDQFFICPLSDDVDSDFTFDELRAFMKTQGGRKIGFNIVLREGAKSPTPARRVRTREQMDAVEYGLTHSATVILGAGFFASLFLGVASTMMRVRPANVPRLLTQDISEFAKFVAEHSRSQPNCFEVLSTTNWILHEVAARRETPSSLQATG